MTTVAVPVGRRERKKQETRAALEAAALRLFAEQGYEQTTVEDIAAAADVALRTFFRYFSSKQHVLFGDVAHNVGGRLREAFEARPATEPAIEAVRNALEALTFSEPEQTRQISVRLDLMQEQPSLLVSYYAVFTELTDIVAEYAAKHSGQGPNDFFPRLLATAAIGSAQAAVCAWHANQDGPGLDELCREGYDRLTAGLAGMLST
ncbi:TetR family transcriptional regulator [Longispora albida]|uniref:acyl-CoA-like ligand-binding transcription factor n=1 Tax=Longispora albida TaxID=203523 RepID=UPI0003648EA7|nr:TetR family transcriptional regulator [Longispora albida]